MVAVTDREFGELNERVRGIQSDVGSLKTDMASNTRATNEILMRLSAVGGGWKAIAAVGAIAAAVGGIIVKFLPLGFHL